MTPIDWALIPEAISYYQDLGYRYTEVPWIVPDQIARQTFDGDGLMCQAGTLVGSAEQGFLAMPLALDAKLVSCSPCFRNEPVVDELHQTWFMKVELYWGGSHVFECLMDAQKFHEEFFECEALKTSEGYDLIASDIEIGSYGQRTVAGRTWTYGTGLALPRFSIAEN